jgi:hypothetical protein
MNGRVVAGRVERRFALSQLEDVRLRVHRSNYQRMSAPGPLEIFARHKEHDAIVMWVPDADLLGSGAPTSGDHNDIAIVAHNEKRLGGRGSLQPLPIELSPPGVEPELGGKLDEA